MNEWVMKIMPTDDDNDHHHRWPWCQAKANKWQKRIKERWLFIALS